MNFYKGIYSLYFILFLYILSNLWNDEYSEL